MHFQLTIYMFILTGNGVYLHIDSNFKNENGTKNYPRRGFHRILDNFLSTRDNAPPTLNTPYSSKTPDYDTAIYYTSTLDFDSSSSSNKMSEYGTKLDSEKPHHDRNLSFSEMMQGYQSTSVSPTAYSTQNTAHTAYNRTTHSTNRSFANNTSHSPSLQYVNSTPISTDTPYALNTPHSENIIYANITPHSVSTPYPINTTFPSITRYANTTPYSYLLTYNNNFSWYNDYEYYNYDYYNDTSFEPFYLFVFKNSRETKPFVYEALKLCPQIEFCFITHMENDAKVDDDSNETLNDVGGAISTASTWSSQCCTYCSCMPDCFDMNNCCPGATAIHKPIFRSPQCYQSYESTTSISKLQEFSEITQLKTITYKTRLDCYINGQRPPAIETFDDLVRVSKGNNLYINKYCAITSGETDFIRWRLIATACTEDLYTLQLASSDFETYVLNNCAVYSIPPAGLDPGPFICYAFNDLITSCNVTGLWDSFNNDIEIMCQAYPANYVYDEEGAVYFNIFCLMCNKPTDYKAPSSCPRRQDKEPLAVSFNLLVDKKSNYNYLNNTGCSSIQVFDGLQDSCRNLLCPFQHLPDRGVCVHRQFEARNRVFPILIQIDLFESFPINVLKLSANSVLLQLFENLNINSLVLQKTYLSAFISIFTDYVEFLLLTLHVRSSSDVDETWITDFLQNLEQSNDSYIKIENIKFPLRISPAVQHEKKGEWHSFWTDIFNKEEILLNRTIKCPECYLLSIGKKSCPHIKLNKSEYCLIENKLFDSPFPACLSASHKSDGNFAVENGIANGDFTEIFYVCWDDYKIMTERWWNETAEISLSATAKRPSLSISIVILLAVYFMCI